MKKSMKLCLMEPCLMLHITLYEPLVSSQTNHPWVKTTLVAHYMASRMHAGRSGAINTKRLNDGSDLEVIVAVRGGRRQQRECARALVPRKRVHAVRTVEVLACAAARRASGQVNCKPL